MNNFIFENSTKVFFGKGCVKEYLCCLTKAYGDTVMLCYGGGSIKKNGIYDEVTNILEAAGKTVVEFSGIMANPTYAKVLDGAKLAKKNDVSLLFWNAVSIGGVKQGKFRVALRIISARLDFQFLIGNNCSAVALAARTCHSNDHA